MTRPQSGQAITVVYAKGVHFLLHYTNLNSHIIDIIASVIVLIEVINTFF